MPNEIQISYSVIHGSVDSWLISDANDRDLSQHIKCVTTVTHARTHARTHAHKQAGTHAGTQAPLKAQHIVGAVILEVR